MRLLAFCFAHPERNAAGGHRLHPPEQPGDPMLSRRGQPCLVREPKRLRRDPLDGVCTQRQPDLWGRPITAPLRVVSNPAHQGRLPQTRLAEHRPSSLEQTRDQPRTQHIAPIAQLSRPARPDRRNDIRTRLERVVHGASHADKFISAMDEALPYPGTEECVGQLGQDPFSLRQSRVSQPGSERRDRTREPAVEARPTLGSDGVHLTVEGGREVVAEPPAPVELGFGRRDLRVTLPAHHRQQVAGDAVPPIWSPCSCRYALLRDLAERVVERANGLVGEAGVVVEDRVRRGDAAHGPHFKGASVDVADQGGTGDGSAQPEDLGEDAGAVLISGEQLYGSSHAIQHEVEGGQFRALVQGVVDNPRSSAVIHKQSLEQANSVSFGDGEAHLGNRDSSPTSNVSTNHRTPLLDRMDRPAVDR